MSKSAGDDIVKLIGIADQFYISGRYLVRSAVFVPGFSNLNQAFEQVMKAIVWMERKMVHSEDLSWKEIKNTYGHSTPNLFKNIQKIYPEGHFDDKWSNLFDLLEKNYHRRYPDNWDEVFTESFDLNAIDYYYLWLRNEIYRTFPEPHKSESVVFLGTDLYGQFFVKGNFADVIKRTGAISPWEMYLLNNQQAGNFDFKKYNEVAPETPSKEFE